MPVHHDQHRTRRHAGQPDPRGRGRHCVRPGSFELNAGQVERWLTRAAAFTLGGLLLLPPLAGVLADRTAGSTVVISSAALAIGAASLSVGLMRQNATLLLPVMLGGTFGSALLASELVRQSLLTGTRATIWLGIAVGYIGLVLRVVDQRTVEPLPVERLVQPRGRRMVQVHRVRTAIATALLLAPATALWIRWPQTTAAEPDAQARLIFPLLLTFFLWSVLLYLFYVSPDLGSDLDARHQAGRAPRTDVVRSITLTAIASLILWLASGVMR